MNRINDHVTRPEFEEWLKGTIGFKKCAQRGQAMRFSTVFDGSYRDFRVNDRWSAWRAALKFSENKAV